MTDATTGKTSKDEPAIDWERLRRMTPEEVRAGIEADPDAHPTDEAFWKGAKVVGVSPVRARALYMPPHLRHDIS